MDAHNRASSVRAEDTVDIPALHAWISTHTDVPQVEPTLKQFRGGASNLTYLVEYPDQRFVLRRPPHGHKAASAHDMTREVAVQRAIRPNYPLVPTIIGLNTDPAILGGDFYVMEYLDGSILRGDLPDDVHLSAPQITTLANTVIDALADLHALPTDDLAALNRGPGYVQRQVSGWSGRYRAARTDDVPDGEGVMAWLDAHQPADVDLVLIHGDWRFDNLVLDLPGQRIVGVLDWEMSTIGDPLMDLGASLAYWVQADDDPAFVLLRRQPSHLPGMPTRAEFVQRYAERSGRSIDDWRFYEVFGLFRLAVIIQQIWFRYQRGETTNPAFAHFGAGVNILMNRALDRLSAP
jgi:aminoglycoside phosphotransferase (APT) family kinase protein